MTDPTKDIDFHKRRRRVTKLTPLALMLFDWHKTWPQNSRLLDVEFKTHQLAIIDLTEGDVDDAVVLT